MTVRAPAQERSCLVVGVGVAIKADQIRPCVSASLVQGGRRRHRSFYRRGGGATDYDLASREGGGAATGLRPIRSPSRFAPHVIRSAQERSWDQRRYARCSSGASTSGAEAEVLARPCERGPSPVVLARAHAGVSERQEHLTASPNAPRTGERLDTNPSQSTGNSALHPQQHYGAESHKARAIVDVSSRTAFPWDYLVAAMWTGSEGRSLPTRSADMFPRHGGMDIACCDAAGE